MKTGRREEKLNMILIHNRNVVWHEKITKKLKFFFSILN